MRPEPAIATTALAPMAAPTAIRPIRPKLRIFAHFGRSQSPPEPKNHGSITDPYGSIIAGYGSTADPHGSTAAGYGSAIPGNPPIIAGHPGTVAGYRSMTDPYGSAAAGYPSIIPRSRVDD